MKLLSKIKTLIKLYLGELEYNVTLASADGRTGTYIVKSESELDDYVNKINLEPYWMISKIDKVRRLPFSYQKPVSHTPLHFSDERFTEKYNVRDWEYSFLKIDSSLSNVIRK